MRVVVRSEWCFAYSHPSEGTQPALKRGGNAKGSVWLRVDDWFHQRRRKSVLVGIRQVMVKGRHVAIY